MIDADDIAGVIALLSGDWLPAGPKVTEFKEVFAPGVGVHQAVALSRGTAALHSAMSAPGIGPGDEVMVPAMTCAASANCMVFQGGSPVFAVADDAMLAQRLRPFRDKALEDLPRSPCEGRQPLRNFTPAGGTQAVMAEIRQRQQPR